MSSNDPGHDVQFSVLGPVRIVQDGAAVPLSEHRRKLLAVLLSRANRVVSVSTLAEVLWGSELLPEQLDRSLHKRLQMHIHRLRRALDDPQRLAGRPGGYQLAVGPGELDAVVFADRFDQAREAGAAGRLDEAVTLCREALELWRGEAYADVDDVD
ncbi:AfsR/SARP family transcriptional regulator, partial [Phytoactinopolyspora endophytica]|uniref:AfsR/SARP family transcriptional regulator n=1 Tax=Phytoactinopolyspora endophytica TaxID=1642495 RepID=UPI00197B3DE8